MTRQTYFTLYLIDAPQAFAEAIEKGYVFDDADNDVRLTGRIRYTDTHGEGLTFQLWNQARDAGVSIDVVDRDQSASSVLIGVEQRPLHRRRAKGIRRRSSIAPRKVESSPALATVSAAVQVERSSQRRGPIVIGSERSNLLLSSVKGVLPFFKEPRRGPEPPPPRTARAAST